MVTSFSASQSCSIINVSGDWKGSSSEAAGAEGSGLGKFHFSRLASYLFGILCSHFHSSTSCSSLASFFWLWLMIYGALKAALLLSASTCSCTRLLLTSFCSSEAWYAPKSPFFSCRWYFLNETYCCYWPMFSYDLKFQTSRFEVLSSSELYHSIGLLCYWGFLKIQLIAALFLISYSPQFSWLLILSAISTPAFTSILLGLLTGACRKLSFALSFPV